MGGYNAATSGWDYLTGADRVGMARSMKPQPGSAQSDYPETI